MEMDEESKARLEKMVASTSQLMLALIKGVVNVGVALSLEPILKNNYAYYSNLMHKHTQLKEI